jgi:predicted ATPase
MNIASIHLRAFRSLYDVNLEPGDLTVLAGPNNAGKTTLANALHFLREAYLYGLEFAVSRAGGYENIAFRRVRRTKQPIEFEVTASIRYRDVPILERRFDRVRRRLRTAGFEEVYGVPPAEWNPVLTFRHRFAFRASGESIEAEFFIDSEELEMGILDDRARPQRLWSITREREDARLHMGAIEDLQADELWQPVTQLMVGPSADLSQYLLGSLLPTSLLTSELSLSTVVRAFVRGLSGIQMYQLAPSAGRLSGSPTPNAFLGQHGQNLPALVAYMQREDPQAWAETLDAMRQIMPELVDIKTTFSPDRRLALQFVDATGGRPWNAEEMSDGTIQALSLFLVLHDRRQPFLIIEEPENSLHPWIVRAVVDTCRSIRNKQVLLTTHSPALLSYLLPDEVVVVWRDDGKSQVEPLVKLDPLAAELWQTGKANVFEILDGGYVRQTVPRGFT